jgi:septum formation protein
MPIPAPVSFILASASPRRQSLLREAGYEFQIHPADIDEDAITNSRQWVPEDLAIELSQSKARAVSAKYPHHIVLAADTVVFAGSEILGKPIDADDARRILGRLSGTTHQVVTGVTLIRPGGPSISRFVFSTVEMRPLQPAEIEAYIATNQWQGKAGAYGIQDRDPFVNRLAGCLTNIVGLPMTTTKEILAIAGVHATPDMR